MRVFASILVAIAANLAPALPVFAEKVPRKGLILWLDASDVAAGGSSNANPPDGTRLTHWMDKSGRGNNVTQTAVSRQPRLMANSLTGRAAVRFDGNAVLQRTGFAGLKSGDRPFHVFVVMRAAMDSGHPNQRLIEFSSADRSKPKPTERIGFWIGYQQNGRNRLGIHYGDEGEARSVWLPAAS
jgi:hypothetical protein